MRRVRSQLNNMAEQSADAGSFVQQPLGYNQHTDEIQQRINAMNAAQSPFAHNQMDPSYASQMHQGNVMQNQYPHPMNMQPNYPQQPAYQPQQQFAPMHPMPPVMPQAMGPSSFEMDNIKASMERLTSKLQGLMQNQSGQTAQNSLFQQTASQITDQYQVISAEMKLIGQAISQLATSATQSQAGTNLAELKSILEQQHNMFMNHVRASEEHFKTTQEQLESNSASQIDPNAYAAAVETSHAQIVRQVDELRSMLDQTFVVLNSQDNSGIEAAVTQAAQSHASLEERITQFEAVFQGNLSNSQNEIIQQITSMQQSIDALNNTSHDQHTLDTSSLDMHLEEINRAIVALSSTDRGIDNLERIEARIADVSKMLDQNQNTQVGAAPAVDFEGIYSRFDSMNASIQALGNSSSVGSSDQNETINGLAAQINKLSEKLDNISSISSFNSIEGDTNNGNSNALLERLDQLVNRVEVIEEPKIDTSIFSALQEQIETISGQIHEFTNTGSLAPDGSGHSDLLMQELKQISSTVEDRLDQLNNRISSFEAPDLDTSMFNSLHQQLEEMSNQIQAISGAGGSLPQSDEEADAVMEQLKYISSTVYQLSLAQEQAGSAESGSPGFGDLGNQIKTLSEQITKFEGGAISEESFAPISSRLTGIEEQLGASRDIALEVASQAAKEAVENTVSHIQMGGDVPAMDMNPIQKLADQVQHLKEANDTMSSSNIETIDAVKDIFSMMAERLNTIESRVMGGVISSDMPLHPDNPTPQRQAPKTNFTPQNNAAGQETAPEQQAGATFTEEAYEITKEENYNEHTVQNDLPEENTPTIAPELTTGSIDQGGAQTNEGDEAINNNAEVDDMPLEPGTGGPDLALLVRQAKERRNGMPDVDTSAYRGNQFRQIAKDAMRVSQLDDENEKGKRNKLGKSALLTKLLSSNKKTLMFAAAGIAIIAVSALITTSFLSSKPENPILSEQGSSVVIEQEGSTQTSENLIALPQTSETEESLTISQDEVSQENEEESLVNEANSLGSVNVATIDTSSANSSLFASEPISSAEGFGVAPSLDNNDEAFKVEETAALSSEIPFGPDVLKQAVDKENPIALFEVGRRYTDGIGTEKNLAEAAKWYELSAEKGFAPAQYIIGNFNEKGIGVERDPQKAATWYETAANNGNIIAMHNLAVLYATPGALGEEPDMVTAFEWFKKAADHGVRDSQVNAGIFNTNGAANGNTDLIEAYKWFAVAGNAGDKDALSKKDIVANAMRPDQLEQAKLITNEWQAATIDKSANEVIVPDSWKDTVSIADAPVIDKTTIRQVQATLSKLGFDAGPADGVIGKKTRDAVLAFQAKIGMPKSGRIDTQLVQVLKQVST